MNPLPVLILTGPPGAGKTTTAKILAERSPAAVHLEADAFFHFIRSGRIEPWRRESQQQNEVVMKIVAEAAAAYARAGYFTVIEGIVLPRWFLFPLRDVLRGAGLEVAYVVLRAPLDTCNARVQGRDGQSLSGLEAVTPLFSQFADLGPFEKNALDVAGKTPAETADAVEHLLAQETHAL
jgi:predicted kinase